MAIDDPTARLLEKLVDAGLPAVGVQRRPDGRFVVDMAPDATPEQASQAQDFADDYEDRRRRPRPLQAIYADLRALPQADFLKALAAVAAVVLQDNPAIATRLGINVPGDEDAI